MDGLGDIWMVLSEKPDGIAEALFVTGSRDYKPFQLKTDIRKSRYTVVDRCRLNLIIGNK